MNSFINKSTFHLSRPRQALLEKMLQEKGINLSSPYHISPRQDDNNLPLSFAQERLWFLDQLMPNNPSYNINAVVSIEGALDRDVLRQSLNAVIQRHEILRTTFPVIDGQPRQIIAPTLKVDLPLVDLRALPTPEREAEAMRTAVADARATFDLVSGPPLRMTLLWLDEEVYQVNFSIHHIYSDAWSSDIFLKEMMVLYQAHLQGKAAHLPKPTIQYADYTIWQIEWLKGNILEEQLAYWKKQLSGQLPVLSLPTDLPRPTVQTQRGAAQYFQLPLPTAKAVQSFSKKVGMTPFMILLTAFGCLLHRYTGQEDIIIGVPIANRNQAQTEELIGFLVNTLALRINFANNPTFHELLQQVQQVTTNGYSHQDIPFEKLVGELQIERNMRYSPLFQAMFTYRNAPQTMVYGDVLLKQIAVHNDTAKRDLTFSVVDSGEKLYGFVEYNTDLFNNDTINRLIDSFHTLLKSSMLDPNQCLGVLPLMTEMERQRLLTAWNDTDVNYPHQHLIHQLFEVQAEKTPQAVALVCAGNQLTYATLNQRANQLAHYLRPFGVGPEVVVGLCTTHSTDMMVGLLAVLKVGGAYLPLDPTYPQEHLTLMMAEAQSHLVITQAPFATSFTNDDTQIICIDSAWETIAQESKENPISSGEQAQLAYVLYTSGSSGKPKGVAVEHKQLLNYVSAISDNLSLLPGMRYAMVQPLTVDSCITALFPSLITGGECHLIPKELALDAFGLADYFSQWPMDVLKIAPSHLAALQTSSQPERVMPQAQLVVGGEASHWEWLCSLQALAPDCTIFNHYGPTETTVGVLTYCLKTDHEMASYVTSPLGYPLANTQAYVLDPYLNPVPVGVVGELYIGGENVARGYLHHPALTSDRFVPDPFGSGRRLYKTGDLARALPHGTILFQGRLDEQVKIRGYRVELEEIEIAVKAHPSVRETAVLTHQNNGSSKSLVAYMTLNHQASLTTHDLRQFLSQKLPQHMIPSAFHTLESLPQTPHGKLDRQGLLSLARVHHTTNEQYTPPQTEIEHIVTQIWQELLQVEQVSIYDNFFELGGHSLLIVQLHIKLQESLKKKFPLITLFNHPTVSAQAAHLSNDQRQEPAAQRGLSRGDKQKEIMRRRQQLAQANRRKS